MRPRQNAPRSIRRLAQAAALLFALGVSQARPDEPKLETESYLIPSADPGIQLYIRNKHAAGVTSFARDRILLYVHGATYPSETAFDLPLNGRSMMDYIAQQGFDVYLVDVRGYGGSTRPPEMDQPPADNKPIVDTPTAVEGRRCRRRSHLAKARRRQDRPDGLVVGHGDHGHVHRPSITTRSTGWCFMPRSGCSRRAR